MDTGKKSMLQCVLYLVAVFTVGITLFITLINRLAFSDYGTPQGDTNQIVMNICIFVQLGIWTLYIYAKLDPEPETAMWGLVTVGSATVGWIGALTASPGTSRVMFVWVFMASFTIVVLLVFNFACYEETVQILRVSTALIIVCIIAMIILFNQGDFYILENMAFICYCLVSLAFFLVNPPSHWSIRPEPHATPYDSEI
jgi:hypothetical protein